MKVRITQSSISLVDTMRMSFPELYANEPSTLRRFLRWSRNAFLIAGASMLGYAGFIVVGANLYQTSQVRQFQQQLFEIQSANSIADNSAILRPVVLPAGALGKIEISRLNVSAMIMEGVDERTLKLAVGHVPGTPLPGRLGNVAIAGHRDTFFRPLRNIRQGDKIALTTLDGPHIYLVDSTQVVNPDDIQVLDDSDESIMTLITCYPFYFIGPSPKRFIVRAHKIPQ